MVSIPGYHILEKIHQSDTCDLYRAQQESGKPCILKVLTGSTPPAEELLRFKREYEITKKLCSEGIIETYGLEKLGNGLVMILEDFGAVSLDSILRERRLELREFLEIAIKLVDILGFFHSQQVIHKDINPSNILWNAKSHTLKIIDFGISSELSRENPAILSPNVLEGTLPFMAPEQTGRMNRAVDYRSDYYSLGATFYTMLTQKRPFESKDALTLVHSHMAKSPIAPHLIYADIPEVLSLIIGKLMEKIAENRYQSTFRLKKDLMQCLDALDQNERVGHFPVGANDISRHFQIHEKLYGREEQTQKLLAQFDRVSQGKAEMSLVAGYSGIGKSALVNEIHKPIVAKKGYFTSGKFDQFQRDMPYASLIQAFTDLLRQILSEPQNRVSVWKEKIVEALGQQGQVIVNVIPELELIIGKQPALLELGPNESLNRFNAVFQKFVRTFASAPHPLAIFLDDLQWADSPSLKLIELLMTDSEVEHIFLIGAYRDNEVSGAHPLMLTLNKIKEKGGEMTTITLEPLEIENVTDLIADSVSRKREDVEPLSHLCMQKTGGNPFFLNQFLRALYEEHQLGFDREQGFWIWDTEKIRNAEMTENVVELMANKLKKLPEKTQNVLKLASCIGASFDLSILSIASEKPPLETANLLWEALEEGMVVPKGEAYKFVQEDDAKKVRYRFLHDRVQQAAYSLIEKRDLSTIHYRIGELLWENSSEKEQEDYLFDVVNHLNYGLESLDDPEKKIMLARMNLKAGEKARLSVAFEPAFNYFCNGMSLLNEQSWEEHYELTLQLFMGKAEVAFVTGKLEEAKDLYLCAKECSTNDFDKVEIHVNLMSLASTSGEFGEGVASGLEALRLMGVEFRSEKELEAEIAEEAGQIEKTMKHRKVSELFYLHQMTDQKKQLSLKLLAHLWTIAFQVGRLDYLEATTIRSVSISLKYGNSEDSAFGYTLYGMKRALQGEFEQGQEFGELALKLNERFQNIDLIAKTNNIFGHAINPFNRHLKTNLTLYRRGYEGASMSGDVIYGGWALLFIVLTKLAIGHPLGEIIEDAETFVKNIKDSSDPHLIRWYLGLVQIILYLAGRSGEDGNIDGNGFNEAESNEFWRGAEFHSGANFHAYLKMQVLFMDGLYDRAFKLAQSIEVFLPSNFGFWPQYKFFYFYPLILAQLYPDASPENQERYLADFRKYHVHVKVWAKSCPANFLHKSLLLQAEEARILGKDMEAMKLYDGALASAKENDYVNSEALINELAAEFYLKRGFDFIAKSYLRMAYYSYQKWGAGRKVNQFHLKYPEFLSQRRSDGGTTIGRTMLSSPASSQGTSMLDFQTIMKANQAISGEIRLENALQKMIAIVNENAGAESGLLILQKEGHFFVEAEQIAGSPVKVLHSTPLVEHKHLSEAIVNYVIRTQQSVVLDDASKDQQFGSTPYIVRTQPKSILCSPILYQGKLTGVLYLENNVSIGAFTADRLEVLNLLSTQIAISLENGLLYQKEIAAKQKLQKLNAIGTQLARIFDRKQVLSLIFKALQEESGTQRLSLYLKQPTSDDELFLFTTLPELSDGDFSSGALKKIVAFGQGAIGTAAQEQRAIYLKDTKHNEAFPLNVKVPASLLCLPLLDREALVGVLCLSALAFSLEDSSQERIIVEALCQFLTISLKNIQLMGEIKLTTRMEVELQTAATVQNSLFPKSLPHFPQLEIAGHYQPASETGGDWYGVNNQIDNTLYLMIGDVTGHGTPSALVTASVSAACHTLIQLWQDRTTQQSSVSHEKQQTVLSSSDVLHYLNQTVLDVGAPDYLMTFFVARIDLLTGELFFSSAGHTLPVLIRNGKEKRLLNQGNRLGEPSSRATAPVFTEKSIQLEKGDTLFFFTDGLTECENAEEEVWGERKLVRFLKKNAHLPAQNIVDQVIVENQKFCGETSLEDDIAMIVCRVLQSFSSP